MIRLDKEEVLTFLAVARPAPHTALAGAGPNIRRQLGIWDQAVVVHLGLDVPPDVPAAEPGGRAPDLTLVQLIDLDHVTVVMASLPLAHLTRLRLLLDISLFLWPIRIGTVTAL